MRIGSRRRCLLGGAPSFPPKSKPSFRQSSELPTACRRPREHNTRSSARPAQPNASQDVASRGSAWSRVAVVRNHNSRRGRKSCTRASVPIACLPSDNPRRHPAFLLAEMRLPSNLSGHHRFLLHSHPFGICSFVASFKNYALSLHDSAGSVPRPGSATAALPDWKSHRLGQDFSPVLE